LSASYACTLIEYYVLPTKVQGQSSDCNEWWNSTGIIFWGNSWHSSI